MIDCDAEALDLYRRHALDPENPPSVSTLVRCFLRAPIVRHGGVKRAHYVSATREVWVPARWPEHWVAWNVAHELGEWWLGEIDYREPDVEEMAQWMAGALIAPRPFVRAAVAAFGRDLGELAPTLHLSQSATALRLGEVTGSPLALVTSKRIHVRGEGWVWPTEETIRGWAKKGPPDGLVKEPITDAPRRAVLRVA
jgi:hypothetical protein